MDQFSQNLRRTWSHLVDPSFGQKLVLGRQLGLVKFQVLADFWPKWTFFKVDFWSKMVRISQVLASKTRTWKKAFREILLRSPRSVYTAELSGVGSPTRRASTFWPKVCRWPGFWVLKSKNDPKMDHFWRGFWIIFGQVLTSRRAGLGSTRTWAGGEASRRRSPPPSGNQFEARLWLERKFRAPRRS